MGSWKTILKNGGVFESEFTEENGNIVNRYWIGTFDSNQREALMAPYIEQAANKS